MHFLPLQLCPIDTAHYLISGDVTIHEGVTIAPGVLLLADPGSQIIIGAGVCIGIGSVLRVHEGILNVGAGVSLGAGVLLVGQVTIGDRACIGAATTILESVIAAGALVASGSLVGDRSRPLDALLKKTLLKLKQHPWWMGLPIPGVSLKLLLSQKPYPKSYPPQLRLLSTHRLNQTRRRSPMFMDSLM